MPPNLNQFGRDGHGDLFRGFGMDVQPDGGVDGMDQVFRESFLFQGLENNPPFMLAADHPQIMGRIFKDFTQDLMIVHMTAGDDNNKGIGSERIPLEHLFKRPDDNFIGFGKTLGVGEFGSIIKDRHPETDHLAQGTKS
ncbi:MAG: hypothetical protein WA974_03850 [Thermodesulfobacteriota bacterium]